MSRNIEEHIRIHKILGVTSGGGTVVSGVSDTFKTIKADTGDDLVADGEDEFTVLGLGGIETNGSAALLMPKFLEIDGSALLPRDGSSAMLGSLDMGGFNVSNVGTIDGDDVAAHIADSSIHFAESTINHANLVNIGNNDHDDIDVHIATTGIHTDFSTLDNLFLNGSGDTVSGVLCFEQHIALKSTTTPPTVAGEGHLYKKSDGKLYYRSPEIAEVELSTHTAGSGASAPKIVRWHATRHQVSGSPASVVITLPWTPTDGNRLFLLHGGEAPGIASGIASVTQTGVTWAEKAKAERSTAGCRVYMWYSNVVSSAGTTVTVTAGGTSNIYGLTHIVEMSGVSTDADPIIDQDSPGIGFSFTHGDNTDDGSPQELCVFGNLELTTYNNFILGIVTEQRPTLQTMMNFNQSGLRILNIRDGPRSGGTYLYNQTMLFGGEQISGRIEKSDLSQLFWYPTIPGGFTNGYAYVWGAIKPA